MKQSYKEIGKELVFVCKGLGGVKVCKMGYGCGLDREGEKLLVIRVRSSQGWVQNVKHMIGKIDFYYIEGLLLKSAQQIKEFGRNIRVLGEDAEVK